MSNSGKPVIPENVVEMLRRASDAARTAPDDMAAFEGAATRASEELRAAMPARAAQSAPAQAASGQVDATRHRVPSVVIYEVMEQDLDALTLFSADARAAESRRSFFGGTALSAGMSLLSLCASAGTTFTWPAVILLLIAAIGAALCVASHLALVKAEARVTPLQAKLRETRSR